MPIIQRPDGTWTAEGTSTVVYDYEEKNGWMYEVAILCVIRKDYVAERTLRKRKLFKIADLEGKGE